MSSPRLVVVSNHCISQTDANGRSLLNGLSQFDKEQLYQIYSSNDDLSTKHCSDYLQLSNKNALRGVLGFGKPADYSPKYTPPGDYTSLGSMKNASTMLIRDLVWHNSFGMKRVIKNWAKQIKPNAVILQLGDSANLIDIALAISKYCNIPIITYNTEDYYFKNYDYMKGNEKGNFLFNIFQGRFRRYVKKLFKNNKTVFCNCDGLKKLFDKEFDLNCNVVYTTSTFSCTESAAARQDGFISYCGNLGVNRHKSLIEIGNALNEIDSTLKLDVYGNPPTDSIKEELNNAVGINFNGVVSYEKVQEIINNSRLLIHVEGFDSYTIMDTRYAFSTKLADYCCSGIPMFVYAPLTGEGMSYIKANGLGFTASNSEELVSNLKTALFDIQRRNEIVDNAKSAAEKNHNLLTQGNRVKTIILNKINPNMGLND